MLGEILKRGSLLIAGLIIHQQHGLRRIRVFVRITERSSSAHGGGNRQSIQRHTIPTAVLDVPAQNGLIAYEVDLSIGKALAGVDVGAAALNVVAANLFRKDAERACQQQDTNQNTCTQSHKELLTLMAMAILREIRVAKKCL
jgi:hypothetical protein